MALQDPREGFSRFDAKIDSVVCWQLVLGKFRGDAWYSDFSENRKAPSAVPHAVAGCSLRAVHFL